MGKYLVIALFMLLFLSCGKDTFQSRPQLTLKSVSSTIVPPQSGLQIVMRLTDKEGDFVDTIWVEKITTRCPSSNFRDSLLYRIPDDTPRKRNFDGEVVMTFSYAFELQPRCTRDDTATFKFWMRDKEGNRSDTVSTPPIIILKP